MGSAVTDPRGVLAGRDGSAVGTLKGASTRGTRGVRGPPAGVAAVPRSLVREREEAEALGARTDGELRLLREQLEQGRAELVDERGGRRAA
jgi:hypothetical protein